MTPQTPTASMASVFSLGFQIGQLSIAAARAAEVLAAAEAVKKAQAERCRHNGSAHYARMRAASCDAILAQLNAGRETTQAIADAIGLTHGSTYKHLRNLEADGKVIMFGTKKALKWKRA